MERFPTMVAARAMLGERFDELRDKVIAIWRTANEAEITRARAGRGV